MSGVTIENGIVKGFHIPEDEAWRLVPDFARDRDFPFFRTTADFVLAQVVEYARLKGDNESDPDKKKAWDKVRLDIATSELLLRLLDGKPAFSYPPPKSFKSHWYDLVEHAEGIPMLVKFSTYKGGSGGISTFKKGDTFANVDEFTWDIKEVISDEMFIVQYHEDAPKFLLRKANDEEKERLLHPRQSRNKLNEWILIQQGEN